MTPIRKWSLARPILAVLALCFLGSGANAQGITRVCVQSINSQGVSNCVDVGPTTPFPVTGTVGGTGTFSMTPSAGAVFTVQSAAGSNNIGTVTINQTTPTWNGTNAVTAGDAIQVAATPTIQAAAYAINQCIGGFNSIAITNYNGESGFLTSFRVSSLAGTAYQLFVYLFDSQPTTSTCVDKGAFTLTQNDEAKLINNPNSSITLAAAAGTTPTFATVDFSPPRPFIAGGSHSSGVNTIWYALGLAAAVTPTTTNDIHVRAGAALN